MDIVLLTKFVPDIDRVPPDAWDRERGTLIRSRLEMGFNPLDRVALRLALGVKAAQPGTRIVALSMGPPSAASMLKEAIAYGADRAVLLTDRKFAGSDTIATAYTLAQGIRQMAARGIIGVDFAVFCGMQSPDGDTAQVPAQVAAFLDAPLYPYVSELAVEAADTLDLRCLQTVGYQRIRTGRRPFVLTATRLCPDLPFYVDLAAMQRANETDVLVWGTGDIDLDPKRIGLDGSRTRVVRIFEPERKHKAREPILAEHEDFPARAADLIRELKAGFSASDATAATTADAAPAATGGYYAGDALALCEMDGERLAAVSFEIASACVQMARTLGCRAGAIVPTGRNDAIAAEFHRHGIGAVHFISGLGDVFRVRERARSVASLLRTLRPQIVIAPATLTGRVLAPYVSALLDCGLTADCSSLGVSDFDRGGETFRNVLFQTRPALGGNIMATIVSIYDDAASGRPQMATVRPGALPVQSPSLTTEDTESTEKSIQIFGAEADTDAADEITVEQPADDATHIDLQDFEAIVCVGMGVRDRGTIDTLVEPFRAALERLLGVRVGLGCSRAVVDAGLLPHARQVGQTGIVVKPKIYIGVGVSGAVQHKIGMENSRIIVAINRDPAAPIHAFADHSLLGDLRQILPALTRAISSPTRN